MVFIQEMNMHGAIWAKYTGLRLQESHSSWTGSEELSGDGSWRHELGPASPKVSAGAAL